MPPGARWATAPRLHIETNEPLELLSSTDPAIIAALEAMGHQVKPAATICGVMNCAEYLKREGTTRAGSDLLVAGSKIEGQSLFC